MCTGAAASVGVVEVDALGGPGVAETLGMSRAGVDLANLVSPLGVPLAWCSPHPAASTTSDATATRARHTRTPPAGVPAVGGREAALCRGARPCPGSPQRLPPARPRVLE